MRRGVKALAAAGAACLLSAAASGAAVRPPTVAGIGLVRVGDSASYAIRHAPASLLIVSTAGAAWAARQPGRSLVYFAGTDVNTKWNAGVSYAQAARNGWLLKDASGELLVNRGYPANYVGDVGNPAYQRAWLANVSRFLKSHGDDGVLIDDVLYDLTPLADAEAAKYPTQPEWAAAELSFIRTVGRGLRAQGYYVLVNASGYVPDDLRSDTGANTAAWWRALGPYVSGLENEYYQETSTGDDTLRSTGGSWSQNWDGWQRLVDVAQSMGRDFVAESYGAADDARAMIYGRASFLLDWNGGRGAYIYVPTDGSNPWTASSTADIGRPAAAKRHVGSGWLRRYTGGVVLVNPSGSRSQSFELPGSFTVPGSGSTVTKVTVPPTEALILRGTPVS